MTDAPPPQPPRDEAARPGPLLLASPLLLAAVYLAFWQVAPRLRFGSAGAVLLSTVISLALLVWFPAATARVVRSPAALLLHLAVSALLALPLRILPALRMELPFPWLQVLELELRWLPGLSGLLFIWFAASIGVLVSRVVRAPNLIPPVAVVLALVDIWTVMLHGPVQQVLQSETEAAARTREAMMVRLPASRHADPGATPLQVDVGFADFLFIAFFVAVVTRFWPERRAYTRTVWLMVAALCAYLVLVTQTDMALPALVPMSVVMLALHWRRFRYTRSEAFALLYAGLVLAAVGIGLWWLTAGPPSDPTGVAEPAPGGPAAIAPEARTGRAA